MVLELGLAYATNKLGKIIFSYLREKVGERQENNFLPENLKIGDEFIFFHNKWEYKLICLKVDDNEIIGISHEAYVNGQVIDLKTALKFTITIK